MQERTLRTMEHPSIQPGTQTQTVKLKNLSIQKFKLASQKAQICRRFMFTDFKTSTLTCQSLGGIQKAGKVCAEAVAAVAAAAAGAVLPD